MVSSCESEQEQVRISLKESESGKILVFSSEFFISTKIYVHTLSRVYKSGKLSTKILL